MAKVKCGFKLCSHNKHEKNAVMGECTAEEIALHGVEVGEEGEEAWAEYLDCAMFKTRGFK